MSNEDIIIIKADGEHVPFEINRIKASIHRTGASKEVVNRVAEDVAKSVREGMTTREIYRMVFERLKQESVCYSCRYDLREAILRMGPAGFNFEKYVASILRAYGYDAEVPEQDLRGACVEHEVDGIARKDGRSHFIEAKFRNKYHDRVNLQAALYTWARYTDLVDGADLGYVERFEEVWLITNAKFSSHAKQFGLCKGMKMIGWNFPEKVNFASLVDHRALYPVTVIDGVSEHELTALAQVGWMLCREIMDHEPDEVATRIDVSLKRAEELIELCGKVVEGGTVTEKEIKMQAKEMVI